MESKAQYYGAVEVEVHLKGVLSLGHPIGLRTLSRVGIYGLRPEVIRVYTGMYTYTCIYGRYNVIRGTFK